MKTIVFLALISLLQSSYGLVIPLGPTTTPFPWADFVKQKFASLAVTPPPTTAAPPTTLPPVVFPEVLFSDFLKQLVAHVQSKAGNETKAVNATTVAPPTTTEGPTENNYEDALMREVYLDWGKRQARQAEVEEQQVPEETEVQISAPEPTSAPINIPPPPQVPNPLFPTVPLTYGYPPGYPFGLFPNLAGFKMSKALLQAQLDAALTAMNITTTPKPTKVKLKFMLPAGSSLPAGLESYIVS